MRTVAMTMALVLMAAAGQAAAENAEQAAPPKCVTAEINPVTGHVLCIDPLGAPVEAPPDAKLPCKPEDARGQWSYGAQLHAHAGGVSCARAVRARPKSRADRDQNEQDGGDQRLIFRPAEIGLAPAPNMPVFMATLLDAVDGKPARRAKVPAATFRQSKARREVRWSYQTARRPRDVEHQP